MDDFNWQKLVSQLLLALRGKRSQNMVNRKLGFSFNQVYRWESCRKRILWAEFVRYARAMDVDVDNALREGLYYKGSTDHMGLGQTIVKSAHYRT